MLQKRNCLCIILVVILIFTVFNGIDTIVTLAESIIPPVIESDAAILVDAVTGQILYGKNENVQKFPASITKVMTCVLALEKGGLDNIFEANAETIDIERNSSSIGISKGERFTVEQLLYATLLVSGNDSANALGQYVSGDLTSFSALMTQRAAEIGCLNTFFWNANGLNYEPEAADKHMTTAYDMALIMKYALSMPKFVEVISTYRYTIPATNKYNLIRNCINTNALINKNGEFYYEYCIGGKTGWTTPAGHTLVTYAEKDGRKLICVTLKGNGRNIAYNDTTKLFKYGFDSFETINLQVNGKTVNITESDKIIGETNVGIANDATVILPKGFDINNLIVNILSPETVNNGENINVEVKVSFPENIQLPEGFSRRELEIKGFVGEITYFPPEIPEEPVTQLPTDNLDEDIEVEDAKKGVPPILWALIFAIIIAVMIFLRIKQIKRIKKKLAMRREYK